MARHKEGIVHNAKVRFSPKGTAIFVILVLQLIQTGLFLWQNFLN